MSLHDASDHLAATFDLGTGPSFADTVTTLTDTRAALAHCRRAATINQTNARRLAITKTTVGDGRVITYRNGARARTHTTVRAADIKHRNPRAYEGSRILVPRVSVTAPAGRAVPPVPGVLDIERDLTIPQLVRAMDNVTNARRDLKPVHDAARDRLLEIATLIDWDGLVRAFTGGWKVQTTVRQYSAAALEERYPAVFRRLARTEHIPERRGYYVLVADGIDPEDEMDEFDGD